MIIILATLLCACPAQADPQPIPMPKELLGWWNDGVEMHRGIEIRPDEIVEQVRKKHKTIDVCRDKYKVIRHFPDKRETYLIAAYYCDGKFEHFSYYKIGDEPIKELHQGPYRHIRIYDGGCTPLEKDWEHFDPDKAWNDILTNPRKCTDGAFGKSGNWPYYR